MQTIAAALQRLGCDDVRTVEWQDAPPKGDAADYVAEGRTRQDIEALPVVQSVGRAAPRDGTQPGEEHHGHAVLHDIFAAGRDANGAGADYLIDEWLVSGQVHLFVATDKLGKTTMALRRASAVSHGRFYLAAANRPGYATRQGRVLLVTELDEEGIHQLLEDDEIEDPDPTCFRVMFLADYDPEERQSVLLDACRSWCPDVLLMDPLDEALGLDEDGIKNPTAVANAFNLLRKLKVTVDATFHKNKLGKVANSYKFTAKPDHYYILDGATAADVVYRYKGRLRAIPRSRRLTGSGREGYAVETLIAGSKMGGRPAVTAERLLTALRGKGELALDAIAVEAELGNEAARKGLDRLVRQGQVRRRGRGIYAIASADETSPTLQTSLSSASRVLGSLPADETPCIGNRRVSSAAATVRADTRDTSTPGVRETSARIRDGQPDDTDREDAVTQVLTTAAVLAAFPGSPASAHQPMQNPELHQRFRTAQKRNVASRERG